MGRITETHVAVAIITMVTFAEKQIYFDACT